MHDGRLYIDARHLLQPPPRWGYGYSEPPQPAQSPERGHPPVEREVRMVSRTHATGVSRAAALAAAGTVCILLLDSSLGAFSIGGANGVIATATIVIASLLSAAVAFWTTRVLMEQNTPRALNSAPQALRRYVAPAVVAFICFYVPYVVLAIVAFVGWRRTIVGADDLVPDPRDAERARDEHTTALAAWQQRITDFETAEAQRWTAAPRWRPVPISSAVRTTCVFGGTARSWTAALTTLGASLLGSMHRVAIVDLTGQSTVDELCELCLSTGIQTLAAPFPGSALADSLLAGLDWEELASVLVEVLHAAQRDRHTSQTERQEDQGVIREVADCLDGSRPASIARLRSALRLLREGEGTAGAAALQQAECDSLLRLGERLRSEQTQTLERITRIERALRGMDVSGRAAIPVSEPAQPGGRGQHAQDGRASLLAIGVDQREDELRGERVAGLLLELLTRKLRHGQMPIDVLVLLGADRFQAHKLESLLSTAEAREISAFMFFEHLRDDAIRLVGAGGAAAAFFRLGNHQEAAEATSFIGSEHRLVIAQETVSAGESLAQARGWERTRSASLNVGMPLTGSVGFTQGTARSYSETFGQSVQYTVGSERVREALIEPQELMGLPLTEMIYVEVLPGGRRVTWNVDCHPQVASSQHAAREPSSEETHRASAARSTITRSAAASEPPRASSPLPKA